MDCVSDVFRRDNEVVFELNDQNLFASADNDDKLHKKLSTIRC
jgi:hypothetical protein